MEEKLDSIIGKIYDVALDQQAWSMLLADISETIGAVAGFYAGLDTRNGRGAFWYTHNHVRVVVLPIGRDEQKRLDDQEARAVVVITESERKSALAPQFLQDQYGLTAAEIRVAIGLASGRSFEELCEVLFVSLPTIKTHARHIFQKMDIHRQAELVRLVYGLPALA